MSAITPRQAKQIRQRLTDAAEMLDALIVALCQRGLDQSDPELAALIDEARCQRDQCIRV